MVREEYVWNNWMFHDFLEAKSTKFHHVSGLQVTCTSQKVRRRFATSANPVSFNRCPPTTFRNWRPYEPQDPWKTWWTSRSLRHPKNLTARPWNMIVIVRRSSFFGFRPIFQGRLLLNFQGATVTPSLYCLLLIGTPSRAARESCPSAARAPSEMSFLLSSMRRSLRAYHWILAPTFPETNSSL